MPALGARPGCSRLVWPAAPRLSSRPLTTCPRRPLTTCFAHTASDHHNSGAASYERVLRYPDGAVRRIRYPAPTPAEDASTASEASGDTWETLNVWKSAAARSKQQAGKPAEAAAAAAAPPPEPAAAGAAAGPTGISGFQQAPEDEGEAKEAVERVPDSPLQLLRYLTSDSYKASQRELQRKVAASYEVLAGCPWVAPRPLYVLAAQQPGREAALTYTLRTRVARSDMEDELSRVLGRRRPDGSPVIRCAEVKDGVIAFESEEEASRFADLLEAEGGYSEVAVAQCDSHSLFRSVQSAQGVVVLLRPSAAQAGYLPQPHQLATALRGQRSMEEDSLASGDEES